MGCKGCGGGERKCRQMEKGKDEGGGADRDRQERLADGRIMSLKGGLSQSAGEKTRCSCSL